MRILIESPYKENYRYPNSMYVIRRRNSNFFLDVNIVLFTQEKRDYDCQAKCVVTERGDNYNY